MRTVWVVALLVGLVGCAGGLPEDDTELSPSALRWQGYGYLGEWDSKANIPCDFGMPPNPAIDYYPVRQIGTQANPGSPTFGGPTSLKMEVRSEEQRDCGGRFHAHVRKDDTGGLNETLYYSFATFFPRYDVNSEGLTVYQWFNSGQAVVPMVMVYRETGGKLGFKVIKVREDAGDDVWVDVGTVRLGAWNTVIFGIRWSNGTDGAVKVWLNSTNPNAPTVTYRGRTCNNYCTSTLAARMTVGAYMPRWYDVGLPPTAQHRWVFHDSIKIGTAFSDVLY